MSKYQEIKGKIYFQRQDRFSNLCGLHMVNNFFGLPKYNQKSMNEICYGLSEEFINPHKSIFGGNYDINVLMAVFQKEGIQLIYHDQRKQIDLNDQQSGYVINYQIHQCFLFKFFGLGRHWEVIKKDKDKFMELDSLLQGPRALNLKNQIKIDALFQRQCIRLKPKLSQQKVHDFDESKIIRLLWKDNIIILPHQASI